MRKREATDDLISRQAAIACWGLYQTVIVYLFTVSGQRWILQSCRKEKRMKKDDVAIILVQYIVCGIPSVSVQDNMRIRDRRFIAETEEDVKAGIRQLYDIICEVYPLEEFPNRQIHICGVFRGIACDMVGLLEEGETDE